MAAAVTVLLAAGACGAETTTDAAGSPAEPAATADPAIDQGEADDTTGDTTITAAAVGDSPATTAAAPVPAADWPLSFQHAAVGGGTIDFAALAGTPVALWFWAPG